jgi:hypothetical protein
MRGRSLAPLVKTRDFGMTPTEGVRPRVVFTWGEKSSRIEYNESGG